MFKEKGFDSHIRRDQVHHILLGTMQVSAWEILVLEVK
jgi:mannose-6-phosphate isomerase-like protein (cupin superfamily)